SELSCALMNTSPVLGSAAGPPQFVPPEAPGNCTLLFGGAPSSWNNHGVYGPAFSKPPLLSHSAWHSATCCAEVSSARTMSRSLLNSTRPNERAGLTGNGCVGEYHSSGTDPFGTGRSSTPKIGFPVTRFRMNM